MNLLRESLFGSYAKVRQIHTCAHDWIPEPGYILDNPTHIVWARCGVCGTRWSVPHTGYAPEEPLESRMRLRVVSGGGSVHHCLGKIANPGACDSCVCLGT